MRGPRRGNDSRLIAFCLYSIYFNRKLIGDKRQEANKLMMMMTLTLVASQLFIGTILNTHMLGHSTVLEHLKMTREFIYTRLLLL